MKLPDDKQERTKVLALIGIGVVVVVALGYMYGIAPMLQKNKKKTARIEKLKTEIRKASKVINKQPQYLKENIETLSKLKEITESFTLRASIGRNYDLAASETIKKHSIKHGVQPQVVKTGPTTIAKSTRNRDPYIFGMYAARVNIECGLHKLVPILNGIEKGNPYLCVSRLAVTANDATPDTHRISFVVQWPIWSDPEAPVIISDQIKESRDMLAGNKPKGNTSDGENKQ